MLVADDDPDTRSLLFELLDQAGYLVTLVAGGIDAMRQLSHRHFDLVLTDLQMGDLHGALVVRNIRNLWPRTPVIIVTGHPEDLMLRAALAAGAADLILKPFGREDLLLRIRDALQRAGSGIPMTEESPR